MNDKERIKEAIRRLDDIRAVCHDFRIGHRIQIDLDCLKAILDPTYTTDLGFSAESPTFKS